MTFASFSVLAKAEKKTTMDYEMKEAIKQRSEGPQFLESWLRRGNE